MEILSLYGLYGIFVSLAFLHSSGAQLTQVTGTLGETLTLTCSQITSDMVSLQWADSIHNLQREPIVIFNSTGNPSMAIDTGHPHYDNYLVEDNYDLSILQLSTDDYGKYECGVKPRNGDIRYQKFQVSAVATPSCPETARGKEGETIAIRCEMEYGSNETPHMEWYDSDMQILPSRDAPEIQLFVKIVSVELTMQQHRAEYVCKAGLVSHMHSCITVIDVEYAARDLRITPRKDAYKVNDVISCSANGNPAPTITWHVNGDVISSGTGIHAFTVREEHMLQENTFRCDAQNEANDVLSEEISFKALDSSGKEYEYVPEPSTEASDPEDTMETETGTAKEIKEAPQTPSPTDMEVTKEDGGQVSSATVIGAVVAVILVLLIITIIVIILRRRNDKSKKAKDAEVANGGAKPIPQKDPEAKHDMNEKGRSDLPTDPYDPELRAKHREFSPPPSDPRHRESPEYAVLMNENNNHAALWQKRPDFNNHDAGYA